MLVGERGSALRTRCRQTGSVERSGYFAESAADRFLVVSLSRRIEGGLFTESHSELLRVPRASARAGAFRLLLRGFRFGIA